MLRPLDTKHLQNKSQMCYSVSHPFFDRSHPVVFTKIK